MRNDTNAFASNTASAASAADAAHASTTFLRRALWADAIATGATALLMVVGADLLTGLLALPAPLLRITGLSLLPYTAFVVWLATRPMPSRPVVWAVIVCNGLYAIDCVLILATGWLAPSALGIAFIVMQAIVVAAFAELQYVGLRRVTCVA
jgi:hypothetical protein